MSRGARAPSWPMTMALVMVVLLPATMALPARLPASAAILWMHVAIGRQRFAYRRSGWLAMILCCILSANRAVALRMLRL